MKVREAIELLRMENPEAELHRGGEKPIFGTQEIDEIYSDTTQYGILTTEPVTVQIVVME